ncbi:MAG: hypothetical protein H6556_25115 [Lewinellaceae bacterium]|nr:hypothetical protein [Lewinellaceae bacterium]
MKKNSEAGNHFIILVILILFSFLPGCTPKTKEGVLPEKLLERFIMEKYGVNPNKLGDTVMYAFNHRLYLPELKLEMIFPIIPGGHSEPCIIFFDQNNMRFYHKCNSGGYISSEMLLHNRVKQFLLKKAPEQEYLALPDSLYYRQRGEHPVSILESYLNDAFVNEPISESLFLEILDTYFKGLAYSRVKLEAEEFIAQASIALHDLIQKSITKEFPCSQECIRYVVYELNGLREPTESAFGTYKAIYQSRNADAKIVSIKLDIGKLRSTGPPYYSNADKYYYTLEADRILLAPLPPSILW